MAYTFSLKGSLVTVADWAKRSNLFEGGVQIGEPKAPPAAGYAAAVIMGPWRVAQLTLNNTVEVHEIQVRIYRNMLAQPEANIESELADRTDALKEFIAGNFKLDQEDKVRAVDFGGMFGASVSGKPGYIDVSGTMFRTMDLLLPVIVDDSSLLVP